jgi:hypothetical protein
VPLRKSLDRAAILSVGSLMAHLPVCPCPLTWAGDCGPGSQAGGHGAISTTNGPVLRHSIAAAPVAFYLFHHQQ